MPFSLLIGRDAELSRISHLTGSLFLSGPRGAGKSALLAAAAAAARDAGRRVLVLRGGPGPWPLRQLLLGIRHDLAGLPARTSGPALAFLGLETGPNTDLEKDLSPPDPGDLPAVVRAALTAVAAKTPILIVADDVHDLGEDALATLAALAAQPEGSNVAVLAAGRTPPPDALAALPLLTLPPLGPEDAARLLDERDRSPSARDRATILHRSAGNPAALIEFGSTASPAGGLLAEFTDALAGYRPRYAPCSSTPPRPASPPTLPVWPGQPRTAPRHSRVPRVTLPGTVTPRRPTGHPPSMPVSSPAPAR